ncbi:MAG: cupin domain-containing protein [Clostridia bacterium]|nr:cupin domain-containing protein [Clostridia bacterium]
MSNVNKRTVSGIDIYDYTGENYMPVMRYGAWRVAYLNHDAEFEEKNFHKMERHMKTDEVFVLLQGEAVLVVGDELNKVEMEPHKVYNVPKGVWHHIFTKEGTKVLIVENEDTSETNSEYMSVK